MLDWRVTRSLVSYDQVWVTECLNDINWRVTRSLVSYDEISFTGVKDVLLKGHQIIGELRHPRQPITLRESLKGHQIIGELRQLLTLLIPSYEDWRVTRSLVSYDLSGLEGLQDFEIEGSPDHWWVTTTLIVWIETPLGLKGHQIIGELRLFGSV